MGCAEIILLSLGLSMDAFAVAAADGLCCKNLTRVWYAAIGLTFGIMQGLMPCLGYLLGIHVSGVISAFDHWIALILLGFIGIRMILESRHSGTENADSHMTLRLLLLQGIATAIDAFAVGISFAAGGVPIVSAVSIIAAVTCVLSMLGVLLGRRSGAYIGSRAQIFGGLLLIGIGVKIFLGDVV